MLSVFRINFFLNIVLLIGVSTTTIAQSNSEEYKIKQTLKKEYSKYFKFEIFNRGLENKIIKVRLDSLANKSKSNWNKNDSLIFAQTNILAKNYELANYYYSNITFKDNKHRFNYLCLKYINKNFKSAITAIDSIHPDIKINSELYFFKKIIAFQDSTNGKNNWHNSNISVFRFNVDSNTWVNRKTENLIIPPLKNAASALQKYVFYINDKDQIISRAFRDIGYTLENHVSLTQAYIAYSIGRNYNKSDDQLIEDLKRIKAKMIKKNYSIPIFRRYFPKTKKGRFNYEILKEKIIEEQNDTIPKHIPNFKSNNTTISLPFSADLIMPFGFLMIFIMLILFLKTKQK